MAMFNGTNGQRSLAEINITPLCDCWGFSTLALVPDIGILAGTDIVSVEQASIDSIKVEDFIPIPLPSPLAYHPEIEGHLLKKIHNKDPYLQVAECARLGLGEREYEIVEVC